MGLLEEFTKENAAGECAVLLRLPELEMSYRPDNEERDSMIADDSSCSPD
jgi:hypothetical protein